MPDPYRLLRDTQVIARTTGPNALRDIMQHCEAYCGPLVIQRKRGGRWREFGVVGLTDF